MNLHRNSKQIRAFVEFETRNMKPVDKASWFIGNLGEPFTVYKVMDAVSCSRSTARRAIYERSDRSRWACMFLADASESHIYFPDGWSQEKCMIAVKRLYDGWIGIKPKFFTIVPSASSG